MSDQPDDFYPSDLDDRSDQEWASIEAREADLDSEGDSIAEPPAFERQCRRCGALLFTGNTSGLCADCHETSNRIFDAVWPPQATADPPRVPVPDGPGDRAGSGDERLAQRAPRRRAMSANEPRSVAVLTESDLLPPPAVRFFPVNLYAAMERAEIVACSACGALLANDREGANRSQHQEWHERLMTRLPPPVEDDEPSEADLIRYAQGRDPGYDPVDHQANLDAGRPGL